MEHALLRQLDSSPVTADRLSAEIRDIYDGLTSVEAECIRVTRAEAEGPKSHFTAEKWQALVALHRTLLYEHHDFLMATHHPSATPQLRALVSKYSMPARMWKHGIYAFLDFMRHRRPESQEYLRSFIHLAYQMLALLPEAVPAFTDIWLETLGDLARYGMAIEEADHEGFETWRGTAARWYAQASSRRPMLGRLYHHLAVVEPPGLRKFGLYAKSLTSVTPFPNARDPLSSTCLSFTQHRQELTSGDPRSTEKCIIIFYALVFTGTHEQDSIMHRANESLELLRQQPRELCRIGCDLAITTVAALLQFGSSANPLWRAFNIATQTENEEQHRIEPTSSRDNSAPSPLLAERYFHQCFQFVLREYTARDRRHDALAFIHVSLVWLHALHCLRTRCDNSQGVYDIPFQMERTSLELLARFLNILTGDAPITQTVLASARQARFPMPAIGQQIRPLSEDYVLRGHVWAQFYFCPQWFASESSESQVESEATAQARKERILWLGLYLAFHADQLHYDARRKRFTV